MLVSDLITQAFLNLGTITVLETISTGMQTDAFPKLNADVDSLSAEGLVVPNQVEQIFSLIQNLTAYTVGAAGSWPTASGQRALKIISWRAYYGNVLHSGGRVLSLPEFGEQAQQILGENTPIPKILGADTAYPLINVRVFPPTGSPAGYVELGYLLAIANFATVNDLISLPQGWLQLLAWRLARILYPLYPSPSRKDLIWDMADRAKQGLLTGATMTAPQPQPAAPQGQR